MRYSSFPRAGAVGLALGGILALTGCYHSIITTDLTPGAEVHHEAFKPAFIAGLVPAQVDASRYCQGRRWAKVETQHSFLNWVVGAVTLGIFTPMDIKVYCAAPAASSSSALPAGSPTLRVGPAASDAQRTEALAWAAKFARESGKAVFIAF